jgi:hypothetical protein
MNIAYGIAAFLLIPAIAHLYMATLGRQRYEADLRNGTNRTRWIEYALSSSVLFMVVGLLSGVIDIASLKMLVGLNIIIHIAAYFAEIRTKRLQRPDWLSYSITCVAGALIWLVLALYVWGSTTYGQSGVAGYMWGVYAAIVVFCSAMAINIYMSLRGRGRWADYSFTERVFMLLAWAAKSAIAWQIFAGILN